MTSILRRPVDLFIIIIFTNFLLIAITIDYTQTLYGSILAEEDLDFGIWPPAPILRAYAWWCETVDPLLAHNPLWYSTMAAFSPFLYCPFYVVAIYAFLTEKEWIRIPALMWGYGLILSMIVVVREELYGQYPAKDIPLFLLAYGAYAVMPVVVMARVAHSPVFSKPNKKKQKTN